jgi:hypothetical protein
MAVELRTAVEARLGVNLPLFSLSERLTLAAMAARLVDPLFSDTEAEPATSAATAALTLAVARYETSTHVTAPPPVPPAVPPVEQPSHLASVSA